MTDIPDSLEFLDKNKDFVQKKINKQKDEISSKIEDVIHSEPMEGMYVLHLTESLYLENKKLLQNKGYYVEECPHITIPLHMEDSMDDKHVYKLFPNPPLPKMI